MSKDTQYSGHKLHKLLVERLSDQELRTFCFHLKERVDAAVDYENLEGNGKEAKARELVDHFLRRNRLTELALALQRERSDIDIDQALAEPVRSIGPPPAGTYRGDAIITLQQYFKQNDWRSWWIWCVVIPLAIIVISWPIEEIFVRTGHSYVREFGHGELILLSWSILLGVSLQIKKLNSAARLRRASLIFAVLVLLLFALVRRLLILNQCYLIMPESVALKSFARFSIAITMTSIAFGYFAYWRLKSNVTKAHTRSEQ
jgi:hypothetical protein